MAKITKFSTLMLAEHAMLSNGLISVLNGGVNRLTRPVFPASLGLFLVGIIDFASDYLDGDRISIEVSVSTGDESEFFGQAKGEVASTLIPGADRRGANSSMIIDLRGVGLPGPGVYRVNTTIDDWERQALFFEVVEADVQG
jgi:hypothetical protein